MIAGYPWFTDWGRDTMISLEGLTLVTGRYSEAHDILRTFALHVRHGLIPNMFPEGEREGLYHTADATLWFFHALHRYDTVTGDHALVEELLPVLQDIVRCHRHGTAFNIHVDDDGLLTQGAPGVQLTWMDALVDGWVVTPRQGKAVEINALWHNALVLLAGWLDRAGLAAERDDLRAEAARCRRAFNARFWNPAAQRLNDVVDGEQGDDDACRPNQILAIAVPHSPLDRQYWPAVLESVTRELATPAGLRTLSPAHADYKRVYFGDLRARDAAYHQGTVWPWLMGPFVDAWLAVHPEDAAGARSGSTRCSRTWWTAAASDRSARSSTPSRRSRRAAAARRRGASPSSPAWSSSSPPARCRSGARREAPGQRGGLDGSAAASVLLISLV